MSHEKVLTATAVSGQAFQGCGAVGVGVRVRVRVRGLKGLGEGDDVAGIGRNVMQPTKIPRVKKRKKVMQPAKIPRVTDTRVTHTARARAGYGLCQGQGQGWSWGWGWGWG